MRHANISRITDRTLREPGNNSEPPVATIHPMVHALNPLVLVNAHLHDELQQEIGRRRHSETRLQQALEEIAELREKLNADNVYRQQEVHSDHNFEEVVGQSRALRQVLQQVELVAATDAGVLILGETGTGKELIARAIHQRSRRSRQPLIRINCATLPATLIESELFGHEKGAFTGAVNRRIGRFELADGGTLFLDEVGELPLELQVKLLRVLQEGEFERLGCGRTRKVDVRVIAATNRELEKLVQQGQYRADLYYRLSTFPLQLPPLRERREDIALLVWYFIGKHQGRLGRHIDRIPAPALQALQNYRWPGNVRELENIIERALILSPGDTLLIDADGLLPDQSPDLAGSETNLRQIERSHILVVLERCGWKIQGAGNAAAQLGLHPSTLRARMKKLGIERPG